MQVEWATAHKPREDVCHLIDAVVIPVDKDFRPNFDADNISGCFSASAYSTGNPIKPDQYGNSQRFIALELRGVLLLIHLQGSCFETT
jgi:hypothetical protein